MSKSLEILAIGGALLGAAALLPVPAAAVTVIGDVGACTPGTPSILVRVSGFKTRSGELRLSLYDGDPARWLQKGRKIHKLHMAIPKSGPVDVCVRVPGPGTYAFGVQHDVDGDGDIGARDGGAFSNNAKFSLIDRKPSHSAAAFTVGNEPKRVGIRLLYLKGLSIGPVKNPV